MGRPLCELEGPEMHRSDLFLPPASSFLVVARAMSSLRRANPAQANIYVGNKEFFSFKKVACEMGLLEEVPLVSLHSISKGMSVGCW